MKFIIILSLLSGDLIKKLKLKKTIHMHKKTVC